MADFCKQCADYMGMAFSDFALESPREPGNFPAVRDVLCEGCGPARVDFDGRCLGLCDNPEHYGCEHHPEGGNHRFNNRDHRVYVAAQGRKNPRNRYTKKVRRGQCCYCALGEYGVPVKGSVPYNLEREAKAAIKEQSELPW